MVPDLDPDKPDPDPVWPDLDPAISGSGSGLPGSRSGNIRIWIRLLPDLDPVAAGSKVPHGLSGPVQALWVSYGCHMGVIWGSYEDHIESYGGLLVSYEDHIRGI